MSETPLTTEDLVFASRARRVVVAISTLTVFFAAVGCASSDSSSGEASTSAAAATSPAPADKSASTAGIADSSAESASAEPPAVPQDIRDRGYIRVATAAAYPPDQFIDATTKEVTGWSPDLLTEIAKRLDLEVEFTDIDFASILPGVQSGKFDVGSSSFAVTEERANAVDFVTYSQSGDTLLVKNGNPSNLSLDGLCGSTTGVTKGSVSDISAQTLSEACTSAGDAAIEIQAFPNQNGAILALESGRVDSVIAAITVNAYLAGQSGNKFESIDTVLDAREVGYTFKKGSTELADAFLAVLQEMHADGTYRSIMAEWGVEAAGFADASGFRAVR